MLAFSSAQMPRAPPSRSRSSRSTRRLIFRARSKASGGRTRSSWSTREAPTERSRSAQEAGSARVSQSVAGIWTAEELCAASGDAMTGFSTSMRTKQSARRWRGKSKKRSTAVAEGRSSGQGIQLSTQDLLSRSLDPSRRLVSQLSSAPCRSARGRLDRTASPRSARSARRGRTFCASRSITSRSAAFTIRSSPICASRVWARGPARRGKRPSLVKLLFKPLGKFVETYFIKRGFLDGLPGFIISVNAAHSMFLKYAYLLESRIKKMQILIVDNNIDPDSWGSSELCAMARLAHGATIHVRRAPHDDLPGEAHSRSIASSSRAPRLRSKKRRPGSSGSTRSSGARSTRASPCSDLLRASGPGARDRRQASRQARHPRRIRLGPDRADAHPQARDPRAGCRARFTPFSGTRTRSANCPPG